MHILRNFMLSIRKINNVFGKIMSFLIFPMMLALMYEIVVRYVFHAPTIWANEFSGMLYAVFFLIGGAYALGENVHVKVEVIYKLIPLRIRSIMDLITWSFFYIFCLVVIVEGFHAAKESIMINEHASTVWYPPIWPIKIFIPVAGLLMLLQGIVKTINDIFIAFTKRSILEDEKRGL